MPMNSIPRPRSSRAQTGASILIAIAAIAAMIVSNDRLRDSVAELFGAATGRATGTRQVAVYPKAAWRLAGWDDLDHTVLWVSHIVIAHSDSKPSQVPQLRPPGWQPDPPNPKRTADEALEKAQAIAKQASEHPERFADLAARMSDDIVTAKQGGSLGGIRASQLPPIFLDVLAALKPGEVSQPIATPWGFHVLWRRPAPEEQSVAGKRLVIRYRGTYGGPGTGPSVRTREQASSLARSLAEQLRSGAATFDDLTAKYSETADRIQSGDLGVWSNRESGPYPREIEQLTKLKINAVSEPLETVAGFEIVQRTLSRPRSRFAMSSIKIKFDSTLDASQEHSKAQALELANTLAQRVAKDPSLFQEFQREYCCNGVEQWTDGRGPIGLSQRVNDLAIGEIAAHPIEHDVFFVIPKRLDPEAAPAPAPDGFELPHPPGADIAMLVQRVPGDLGAEATRKLAREATAALDLKPRERAELKHRLALLADFFEAHGSPTEGQARLERMQGTLSELDTELGPATSERFQAYLGAWSRELVMRGSL